MILRLAARRSRRWNDEAMVARYPRKIAMRHQDGRAFVCHGFQMIDFFRGVNSLEHEAGGMIRVSRQVAALSAWSCRVRAAAGPSI